MNIPVCLRCDGVAGCPGRSRWSRGPGPGCSPRGRTRPFPRPRSIWEPSTPGGGFPLYGNVFAAVMNEADPTLSIEPRNTKGSNENIPLLEAGEIDIATVAV